MGALAHLPKGTQVHVSSEGRLEEFGALKRVPNVHFRLNEPLMETFHHMASASSLVIAASTLSATAAFLVAGRGGRLFAHPAGLTMLRYAYSALEVTDCTARNPYHARAMSARRQGRAAPVPALQDRVPWSSRTRRAAARVGS